MPSAPPLPELPEEFPVFPLGGALLLPRGRLPLNIFEPRYLAMVEDALGAGRLIGMIQPDASRPATETGPALFGVGCLGRICSFSETGDGRFLITLHGVTRFRLAAELPMRRGYRRVRAELAPFAADRAPAPASLPINRAALLTELRAFFARHTLQVNWEAVDQMDDTALLTTLSMVCPFDKAEKQALLEASTDLARAETLLALLRLDAHQADNGATPLRAS